MLIFPEIHYVWLGVMMFIITFIVSWAIYPTVLRAARVHKIYDKPDSRKLQQRPVPVLGGVAVFAGMFVGIALFSTLAFHIKNVWAVMAMAVMLVIGVLDDKFGLGVKLRFAIEAAVVFLIVYVTTSAIDNFEGIWGIGKMETWAVYALSILSGVGLMNAMNLIDGVDGYSSGFSMVACIEFAVVFYWARVPGLGIIALICAGSLLPFFLHNVFGERSKMFIGDGGTLMIGTMITVFCFSLIKQSSASNRLLFQEQGAALIPLCLAIMAIPVFDTLRVMFSRVLKGRSPFSPDKTHLHHAFIDLGYSHLGTTLRIIHINLAVLAGWALAWAMGASATLQLYVVAALGILFTFVLYQVLRAVGKREKTLSARLAKKETYMRMVRARAWQWMRKLVDDDLFAEGKDEKI